MAAASHWPPSAPRRHLSHPLRCHLLVAARHRLHHPSHWPPPTAMSLASYCCSINATPKRTPLCLAPPLIRAAPTLFPSGRLCLHARRRRPLHPPWPPPTTSPCHVRRTVRTTAYRLEKQLVPPKLPSLPPIGAVIAATSTLFSSIARPPPLHPASLFAEIPSLPIVPPTVPSITDCHDCHSPCHIASPASVLHCQPPSRGLACTLLSCATSRRLSSHLLPHLAGPTHLPHVVAIARHPPCHHPLCRTLPSVPPIPFLLPEHHAAIHYPPMPPPPSWQPPWTPQPIFLSSCHGPNHLTATSLSLAQCHHY